METKNKIIITVIVAVIIVILISVIVLNIPNSGRKFKVTVLNQSGIELNVYVFALNNTEEYLEGETTLSGLKNGDSRVLYFKPSCKEFTVAVHTTKKLPDDEAAIALEYYYFNNNELYDLQVTILDYGETIIIEKQ